MGWDGDCTLVGHTSDLVQLLKGPVATLGMIVSHAISEATVKVARRDGLHNGDSNGPIELSGLVSHVQTVVPAHRHQGGSTIITAAWPPMGFQKRKLCRQLLALICRAASQPFSRPKYG
jgi:hypothetical protein